MIKVEKVEVYGWEAAIRGMRNPLNSWDKSDSCSVYDNCIDCGIRELCDEQLKNEEFRFCVGPNDLALMKKLANAGADHGKFLRMITVTMDITAPLYWWKEYDTYKVGTVANSCSTMHKIHAKELTLDDFSHEHLNYDSLEILNRLIHGLNEYGEEYRILNDKSAWWQIIQLLPTSYNQKRTVQLNYQVLKHIYHSRQNHKLDEWRNLCEIIETLPYAKELICDE